MNITALLVGFHYPEKTALPGVIVDLYCMASYCKRHGMDYHVLTDYTTDQQLESLIPAMVEGVASHDIQTWIRSMKDQHRHTAFVGAAQVIEWIRGKTAACTHNHLIIYFSGHGKRGGWACPDEAILYPDRIMQTLTHQRPATSEIVHIMDCCETVGEDAGNLWPYELTDHQRAWTRLHKHDLPFVHFILHLSPKDAKPSNSPKGSLFTLKLLQWWDAGVRSLTAYASFCDVRGTWPAGRTLPAWLQRPAATVRVYPWFIQHDLAV